MCTISEEYHRSQLHVGCRSFVKLLAYTYALKKSSLLPEAPLRPEARGICHICYTVNPALSATHQTPASASAPPTRIENWGRKVFVVAKLSRPELYTIS